MELLNRTPTPERCLGRHQTVNAMEKRPPNYQTNKDY